MRKIYLASSWRNQYQPSLIDALRNSGHEVYDFRNPGPDNYGFSWKEIDPLWECWTVDQFKQALLHPASERGFKFDMDAMEWADTFVLALPCGKSAHLELGWACGRGKKTVVYSEESTEPELMYKMVDHIVTNINDLCGVLE